MKNDLVRNWGYQGTYDKYGDLYITNGQCFAGCIAGILVSDTCDYKPVGHVANALTYPFSVRYEIVSSITEGKDEETVTKELQEKALELETVGCRYIAAEGGKFGKYQDAITAVVDIPVYLSPLMQLPWIKVGIKKSEGVLILSDLSAYEAEEVFAVYGIEKEIYENCTFIEVKKDMPPEVVLQYLDESEILEEQNTKAVLIDTQKFAENNSIFKDLYGLYVWDMEKLMNYVYRGVCQKPREGFL